MSRHMAIGTHATAGGDGQQMQEWAIIRGMPQTTPTTSDAQHQAALLEIISLVNQAREGSVPAFNGLVDRFQEEIYRMVTYRVGSRLDAEDITQDVFLRAFNHLSRLKKTDRFKSWLFQIAINGIRDFHRKKRFRALFDTVIDQGEVVDADDLSRDNPQVIDYLIREDFWKKIRSVLDHLSPMEHEVFLLRFFDQLSIREIADVLKKSESTVKTHLYRGLTKFKKEPSILQLRGEWQE